MFCHYSQVSLWWLAVASKQPVYRVIALLLLVNIDGRSAADAKARLRLSRNISIAGVILGLIIIPIYIIIRIHQSKENDEADSSGYGYWSPTVVKRRQAAICMWRQYKQL